MKKITVLEILNDDCFYNKRVCVCGWVRTRRDSKCGFSFIDIYDGSCFDTIQIFAKNYLKNYEEEILKLRAGCSIMVIGFVKKSKSSFQNVEIYAEKIFVFGFVENQDTYPMSSKKHSLEYLRKFPHLRSRTNLIGAVMRVRHTLAKAIHDFFSNHGYIWISTPIITSNNAETGSEMFCVSSLKYMNSCYINNSYEKDFFKKRVFLSVSGQLNAEAYACSLGKVYTFGPTFRAENSNTNYHLAEFWMVEPEVAFADLNDIILLAKDMLKYVINLVLNERFKDLEFFEKYLNQNIFKKLNNFISLDFEEVKYTDIINILKKSKKNFNVSISWGMDLSSEHEKYLLEYYRNRSIVIKEYPKSIKAFYMKLNKDNSTVAAMDILIPGIGEIIGGSEREDRLNILESRIKEFKLKIEDYKWYCDLRKYGTVPHAGFGLGFDRLVLFVTGMSNIRDVVPFPRSPKNVIC